MTKQVSNVFFELERFTADDTDYSNIDSRLLANMALEIFLIREFENALLRLSADGCINGPLHTSIGEEACAVGAMAALKCNDKILSTHRAHHHYLAKIFSHYLEANFDVLTDDLPQTIQAEIADLMGEILGLSIGCCGGRGGSMHLRNERIGVTGTNAIVGGGVPLATGVAFASKYTSLSEN